MNWRNFIPNPQPLRVVVMGLVAVAVGISVVISLVLAVLSSLSAKDNTDPSDSRSGMVLYVDAATGCNYLSSGSQHGITPRLRRDGSHWCDDPQQRAQ